MYSETCEGTGAEIGLSRTKAGCATPRLGFMATPFVAQWLTWEKLQQSQTLILVALSKLLLYVGYCINNLHYVKFLCKLLFQGYILSPISSWVTETKKTKPITTAGQCLLVVILQCPLLLQYGQTNSIMHDAY